MNPHNGENKGSLTDNNHLINLNYLDKLRIYYCKSKIQKVKQNYNAFYQFLLILNSIPWLAISSAISWRNLALRQKLIFSYIYECSRTAVQKNEITSKFICTAYGHTNWSSQISFARTQQQTNSLKTNMVKVAKKKKTSIRQVKEDRVEQYLKEKKAKSKARVAAKLAKKKKAEEAEEKRREKYWEDEEMRSLEALKKQNDEEFKEVEALLIKPISKLNLMKWMTLRCVTQITRTRNTRTKTLLTIWTWNLILKHPPNVIPKAIQMTIPVMDLALQANRL